MGDAEAGELRLVLVRVADAQHAQVRVADVGRQPVDVGEVRLSPPGDLCQALSGGGTDCL
ncbi:hypothetical protein [Streptomyces sioyaensis]|uniref:hypothetical protein n=1 Tax=Streptomyces sioyaensis TaxID=67364 RepID=UPI003789126B